MRPLLSILMVACLTLGAGCAPEAAAPPTLTTAEAAAHLGKEARVRGRVFACHACKGSLEGSWKLCLDAPCGTEPFAVMIKPEVVKQLGEEKLRAMEGKQVEVHGTISEFKGRPEINLDCPMCLIVLPTS